MKKITDQISLRIIKPDLEEDFRKEVFFDSIRDKFSILKLPETQLKAIMEMQYQFQKADYELNYPQATKEVILFNENPIGYIVISTENIDLHLVDIAILSKYRNFGIGTEILKWLIDESSKINYAVKLSVEKNNRAFRLYERLGFRVIAENGTHFQMKLHKKEN